MNFKTPAEHRATGGQHQRGEQVLAVDVQPGRAQGAVNSDLAGALRHRDEQQGGDADAGSQQRGKTGETTVHGGPGAGGTIAPGSSAALH